MTVELFLYRHSPFPHTELLHSLFDDRIRISLLCVANKRGTKYVGKINFFYTNFLQYRATNQVSIKYCKLCVSSGHFLR